MNLLIFRTKTEFKPRPRFGLDAELDQGAKQVLDALDVGEQRDDHHATVLTVLANALAFLILLLLAWAVTHGEDVAKSVEWLLKHIPS